MSPPFHLAAFLPSPSTFSACFAQERIVALHDEITVGAVERLLADLPTEPTAPPPLFRPPQRRPSVAAMVATVTVIAVAFGVTLRLARR